MKVHGTVEVALEKDSYCLEIRYLSKGIIADLKEVSLWHMHTTPQHYVPIVFTCQSHSSFRSANMAGEIFKCWKNMGPHKNYGTM